MISWALAFLAATFGFAAATAVGAGPTLIRRATRHQVVVLVAVVAAATAAMTSSASSTGTPLVDGAYRALVAGAVAYLGSRVRLAMLVPITVATAVLSGGRGSAALGALAAAGALLGWQGLGRSSGSGRAAGPAAVTAACCAVSLLQAGSTLTTGLSALGAGAVMVAIGALGYAKAPGAVQRRVRLLVGGAAGLLGVAAALAVVALAEARPSLEVGVKSATRAAADARQLDSPGAAASMNTAAASFERANARVRSPVGRVGALVPLLGQQLRAVDAASASGADLGRAGMELAEAVDQDTVRIVDGRVPLERLQEAQPKAARAAAAIADARGTLELQQSPWLLPSLDRRLDRVRAQLVTAGEQADLAAALLDEVPPLLGSKGPRRYFVVVQNPSELRGSGGFMGTFAEIAVDDGRLTLARTGRPSDLNQDRSTPRRTLDAPADFLDRYERFAVTTTWQSVTISPHFPSDAQVIRSLYPQSGGRPVDAVVAIDPFAIQAILKVVGPVQVPGAPLPLTGDNAAQALLFDQYRAFPADSQDDRRDYLEGLTQVLTERVLGGGVAVGPLANALGPMVDQKHLMVSAGAAAEEPAFARLGLTGAMAPVQGDALAVVVQNAGASKIDWFLRRTIDYRATLDPRSGALSVNATLQLTNQAPASGLPRYIIGNSVGLPPGTSRMYVSVYSPLRLQSATLDGQPLIVETDIERGRVVYSAYVDVPPGSTRAFALELQGSMPVDRPYRLDLHRQPSAAPDQVTASLALTGTTSPLTRREITLTRDSVFEATLPG